MAISSRAFVSPASAHESADGADELSVRKKSGPRASHRRREREDVLQGDVA
jgi:hypothetical protein